MTINLTDSLQHKIDAQLATGRFTRAEDVLSEALDYYAEHQATLDDLRASMDDLATGRVRPLDEVANDIRARHGWNS